MPRKNETGHEVKLVLGWLLRREVTDREMAAALDMPTATYGRRKKHRTFPTYEELGTLGTYFGLSARALQIAFGHRPKTELEFLSDDEKHQYIDQGGIPPRGAKYAPRQDRSRW